MRPPEQEYDPVTWFQVLKYSEDLADNNIVDNQESTKIINTIDEPSKALEMLAELAIAKHLSFEFNEANDDIAEVDALEKLDKESIQNRLNKFYSKYSFKNLGETSQAIGFVIFASAIFMYGKNPNHDFKPNLPTEFRDIAIMLIGATVLTLGRIVSDKNNFSEEDN